MQTYELMLAVREMGDEVQFYFWSNTTPCPCTAVTGDYSPDWHRDNPGAANCSGRGVIGGQVTSSLRYIIWQPAFLVGRTIREFLDVTQVAELEETDVIVWSAAFWAGGLISWSAYPYIEATFFSKTYHLLRVIPVPWGEVAIFRQVT